MQPFAACGGNGFVSSKYVNAFTGVTRYTLVDEIIEVSAFFGNGFENFVRLNYATSRKILAEILERVEKATPARKP